MHLLREVCAFIGGGVCMLINWGCRFTGGILP